MRKKHPPNFKKQVVIAALKGDKTMAQLSSEFGIQAAQISQWKKKVITSMPDIFRRKNSRKQKEKDELIEELYLKIGKMQHELDWLKKKLGIID